MMLEGKVAVVTGAAGKGMGRSTALTLAREGAKVVVNYRTSEDMAEAVLKHIVSRGGEAIAVQADVFTPDGCKELVDTTMKRFGQIDICIIGPGAGWHPEPPVELNPSNALEDAHKELAPIYHLMPLVLPEMYKRKWGRIIGLALHPTRLPPAYSYNAAKASRRETLRLLSEQTWSNGVTVNIIAPGPVSAIEDLQEAFEQCDHESAWQKRKNVSPQDIAEGVAFLCSEAGRFISGCELPYLFY